MSYTEDMILCDDGFLLIDMKSSKVMKFGFDGKFLYSSGELGRANNEYLRPLDICLSSDKKQYVLLDETGLLYYNITDGHFIKKEKIFDKDQYWNKLIIDKENNIFGFAPFDKNTMVCISANNETVPLRKYKCYQSISRKFYIYNDIVHVLPDWGDYSIAYYDNGQLKTKYIIDFGKDVIPQDWAPQTSKEYEEKDHHYNLFRDITEACETNKYLLLMAVGPDNIWYNVLYNKDTGKTYVGSSLKSCGHQIIGAKGDYVYLLVIPHLLKEDSELFDFWKNIDLQGNENPFVVKIRIKG